MCFTNKFWTHEEDHRLITLVSMRPGPANWSEIAKAFPTKSETQIGERWSKVLDPSLLKGSWTRSEDEMIMSYVARNGTKSWSKLSELLPGRTGKQCRERWCNALDPAINRGPWTPAEDRTIIELHEKYGNHWTKIGELMPTRSDNAIKNRWHSALSKRQLATTSNKILLPPISLLPMPDGAPATFGDLHSLTLQRQRPHFVSGKPILPDRIPSANGMSLEGWHLRSALRHGNE
jgi:hypothetical protein